MGLYTLDYVIFVAYCILILLIGLWVSRDRLGHEKNAEDYFLAGKSLPWWAIGSSLIAANISAEQFIGMSGSGFAIGLAIASYEWMAAITLLIVGKFFLPIFIKKKIFTIPEFIEKRYSTNLKTILALFWIALFVFVNLTTILYLGARAIDTIAGSGDGSLILISVLCIGFFAASYSIWGGLSAVAWTDVVQVVLLIGAGLTTTFIALQHVSPTGQSWDGLVYIYQTFPEKFSMILSPNEIITPDNRDAWWDLPGLSVLIGGMWVANIYYWGFNQYIVQRALAAKSLPEAQKGIAFAAFLKLIIPLIIVIPGIIAFAMNADINGTIHPATADPSFFTSSGTVVNDNAFPWLIQSFIPIGLKGLVMAGLTAAILSSLASMLNSTATIFTMDVYRPYINPKASSKQIVKVGRITVIAALLISMSIAPSLQNIGQAFQFIQEYTGVVSPGILAVFLTGLFWKRATNRSAILGVLTSIPVAFYFKVAPNGWSDSYLFVNLPFMDQMMYTALITLLIIVVISYIEGKGKTDPKGIDIKKDLFYTSPTFNIGASIVLIICTILYAYFW